MLFTICGVREIKRKGKCWFAARHITVRHLFWQFPCLPVALVDASSSPLFQCALFGSFICFYFGLYIFDASEEAVVTSSNKNKRNKIWWNGYEEAWMRSYAKRSENKKKREKEQRRREKISHSPNKVFFEIWFFFCMCCWVSDNFSFHATYTLILHVYAAAVSSSNHLVSFGLLKFGICTAARARQWRLDG